MPHTDNQYYQDNAQLFFDQTVSVDMSEFYCYFLRALPSSARILDAGCGSGRDAKYFLDLGYEVSAFDASPAIAKLASEYIGSDVEILTFLEMEYESVFDGIWACASLLHTPIKELPEVIGRLHKALADGGVLYASFKYGAGEHKRNGRVFTDMNEVGISDLVNRLGSFYELKTWITGDQRNGREGELWLNTLLRSKVKG